MTAFVILPGQMREIAQEAARMFPELGLEMDMLLRHDHTHYYVCGHDSVADYTAVRITACQLDSLAGTGAGGPLHEVRACIRVTCQRHVYVYGRGGR